MFRRVMAYRVYEDIRRGNSVMSRRVIMIITISESLPSTCQFHVNVGRTDEYLYQK